MFLEFKNDLDNLAGGLSSMGDNSESSTQPPALRLLGDVDVGREYIKVVKGDLQWFFVLDFNDQAMNRFVEHQMFSTFKEFWVDCHRHFKKYSELKEAHANPSNILVGRDED
ncbi:CACTA en-spm transposon protein [Cucumis melo var. makuwa]|uniref:CACTA en-spm transposon protein n=1 Tax=Cucumis melo var. makuwa TaxID=1194695 RepID=A0A5A7TKV6_CUCMM|nr:CACTA en-spm transposon protein [Cucumis melo var. makuwa]TYK26773.1 CACTA en-spm transposon protein [Cucumis melo var. makuwa]